MFVNEIIWKHKTHNLSSLKLLNCFHNRYEEGWDVLCIIQNNYCSLRAKKMLIVHKLTADFVFIYIRTKPKNRNVIQLKNNLT
jgi:hypothetical protein